MELLKSVKFVFHVMVSDVSLVAEKLTIVFYVKLIENKNHHSVHALMVSMNKKMKPVKLVVLDV